MGELTRASASDAKQFEKTVEFPQIRADISSSFTYASYQNAVPVIRSIEIVNEAGQMLHDCRLELSSSPPFLRPKSWALDRLLPGDSIALTDRKVEMDAAYLAGLNEAERGDICLQLSVGGEVVDERHIPVRLLARDEWGGVADMVQLLPAFVMPNDGGVARILRGAGDLLAANGHPSGLDGYQSNDPQRAYLLSGAIYSAISAIGLHYSEPPASFETRGQKVRRPSTIEADGLATCLDSSLLFAAALEAAGLHPAILLFDGHAAVGVWLVKRTFPNAIMNDQMEVRKALASNELIIFETTGVTHRPPMSFDAARQALDLRMSEEAADKFVAAIDIRRSRSGGITPLASHDSAQRSAEEGADGSTGLVDLALPQVPNFDHLPAAEVEEKPSTASGRIDRWQKKLLDLTLRNRLLNFPASKKTIPFLCTDVAYLEDRLAEGGAIRLISLPEQNPLGDRDASLYRDVHGKDLQRNFAAEALQRDELPSPLDARDLETRLIDLHRQVRNDFAEGGANTLFLAVGFLRWKKKPEDERSYRAPLLLIPVKLERRSASSSFTLRFHEDEPRFNATLLQFLEREFDLHLPQFNGDLPEDEKGIDVPRVLSMARQAVRDVPGMEVLDDTALSTFSFAKFLMWKDLVERTDALRENALVRHLIDTPDQPFSPGETLTPFRQEDELDRLCDPAEIISLLPSDSSQTAASVAAAEGHNFVIIGPPGTGKSQTIANMIANCLAAGKTVLFVAEKTAALDVVYRRLREHGLGDHCVELHSNKADRRHFLHQLKTSWEKGRRTEESEWVAVNKRLRVRRDGLNAYVGALHKRYPNGWTPYFGLGVALRGADEVAPKLSWHDRDAHDAQTLTELEDLAGELGQVFASVERDLALDLVLCEEWSVRWQGDMLSSALALRNAADLYQGALAGFRATLKLGEPDAPSLDEQAGLVRLAVALDQASGRDVAIAFDEAWAARTAEVEQLAAAISTYRAAEAQLSASYPPQAVRELDVAGLDRQWREASASFWPKSFFGRRKIAKLLQSYAQSGTADPDQNLALLRTMQDELAAIDANGLKAKPVPTNGLETDIGALREHFERANAVRVSLAVPNHEDAALRAFLGAQLREASQDGPLLQAVRKLVAASRGFDEARNSFAERAGRSIRSSELADLAALSAMLDGLISAQNLLRDWAVWCRVKNRATGAGLGPLVELIEAGTIPPAEALPAFRLGYARWWLPLVLDGDPVLRDFRRFQHEHMIAEFRELDDLVRAHATQRVIDVIAHDLPPVQSVPRKSELGMLRHQMELQRPSQSIRDMIGKMPEAFPKLAPCMLMSPLSIAQYFPTNQALFDVVIFDEASQITTWDAVGAIARGRQTVIVGDPKQLPPTNFFGRNEDEEEVDEFERDMESILDEAKAAGIPVCNLRWHYRSRSESLITFSNQHYYQNRLVTFPSPVVEDRAVHLRKVPDGAYDRGKSRTNRIEADAVVAEAVKRMKSWLVLPEKQRPTIGVITFNAQQQSLILDLLEAERRKDSDLEWFFAEERIEPTIVKNLENVQGDERAVILFSITFWKDAAGKLPMDFGALNREGGERRLNVAITRARQELIIFSGFTADKIDINRTKALAVHHLKTFLDYAERGPIALPAQDQGSVGGFDSVFEEAVAVQLEQRGWMIVPQVGVSGFRIDLGVRHPDRAGAYLAGVECDGATYHSAATARDRDKVREEVLRGLGWNILRVWSTDWWFDAKACAERLHMELTALLEESRASEEPDEKDVRHWENDHEIEGIEEIPDDDAVTDKGEGLVIAQQHDGGSEAGHGDRRYTLCDLSRFNPEPERFYELGYRGQLNDMVAAVVEAEGPLRTDILHQRIARAHSWQRCGPRIRERIDQHLRDYDRTDESSGQFIWRSGTISKTLPYRAPNNDETRRAIGEIPLAELTWLVFENKDLLDQQDAARDLARLIGVERLAAPSRARLEEAITQAQAIHVAAE